MSDTTSLHECAVALIRQTPRIPRATYRIQAWKEMPFPRIRELVEYFQYLGISDLYLSPVTQPRPGSNHGYDVVRHNCLNPEAGGEPEFARMAERVRDAGMSLLLDIVPNHMGIDSTAPWWRDVVENGQASRYAEFFDIDWTPLRTDLRGKLLLPVLGNTYGDELESGNLRLCFKDGEFRVCYFDRDMPVSLPGLARHLGPVAEQLPREIAEIISELQQVPSHDAPDAQERARRREMLATLKPRMHDALSGENGGATVERVLAWFKGTPGDSASFDRLHALLEDQPYRLAHWRVSGDEINYRRFFDVNDLVGLRMENPEVFAETHGLVRKLLSDDLVSGLRIDHCDGLFDPRQYLIRLQKLACAARCGGPEPSGEISANGIEQPVREALRYVPWSPATTSVYTLVEKILETREKLPESWPVHGTTGYDFIYLLNNVFVQPRNERAFTELFARFAPEVGDAATVIYEKKLLIMNSALASEVSVLTNLLLQLAMADRRARDYSAKVLATVIRATIASFPVYRTYIDDRGRYTDQDKIYIRYAISSGKRRNPNTSASAFDFLRDTLLLQDREGLTDDESFQKQLYFALKFQQLSGPVMAKGVEDTTFYVYNRFISLNEVGGNVRVFGLALDDFHTANGERAEHSPYTMNASSTHDTKRSEDFRARLNVLSEMPREWRRICLRWQRRNRKLKTTLEDGRVAPDGNEEYFLYQTLAGTLPWHLNNRQERDAYLKRIQDYIRKAMSEAKVNMSWVNPDDSYSNAVNAFAAKLLDPSHNFLADITGMMPAIEVFGAVNALAQQLVKLTSPGVPDIYQGTEMWDFSMVDPDNRRPVDYECRVRALRELREATSHGGPSEELLADMLRNYRDGRVKLWLTHCALECRRAHEALFRDGSYEPLRATNGSADHVIAFAREKNGDRVITIVPRFAYTMMRGKPEFPIGETWGNARLPLPAGEYRCLLSGITVSGDGSPVLLRDVLRSFPCALLVKTN